MDQNTQQTCPTCQGEKIIKGTCECNTEWRGNQVGDEWEDCRCTPDQECPTCGGTGTVD